MEIIKAPVDAIKKRNWKKIVFISALIIIPTVVSIPFIIDYFKESEEKGFKLEGFSLQDYHNDTDSIDLSFDLKYVNEYEGKFAFTSYSLTVDIQNQSETDWQNIMQINREESIIVPEDNTAKFNLSFSVSNDATDQNKRFFLGEILKKADFMLRLQGTFQSSAMSDVDIPGEFTIDIIKPARDIFGYSIPSTGPTFLDLADLETHPANPSYPTKFQLGVFCDYANPFSFPVNFTKSTAVVKNRTLDGVLFNVNWDANDLGNIEGKAKLRIEEILYLDMSQIQWIVEDLLSKRTDVIKLEIVHCIFQIGDVVIDFYRDLETASSSLKFTLTIVGYRASMSGDLILDVEIYNPCNLIFNITHINLDMYVSGTEQKILDANQDLDFTINPYGASIIYDLSVTARYDAFIQHLEDTFDLFGNLDANCYNFDGNIAFDSKEVAILVNT